MRWQSCWVGLLLAGLASLATAAEPEFSVTIEHHFPCPNDAFWFQARATAIPQAGDENPSILLTMQPHGMKGTHNYAGIVSATSPDLGRTWDGPKSHDELEVRTPDQKDLASYLVVPVDATPQYHPQTGKVLLIGATFYVDPQTQKDIPGGQSDIFYAVYDPEDNAWSDWRTVAFPESFRWPYKRSGCAQWVVQPNGELLLPFYFGEHNNSIHYAAVARCQFDGTTLKYVEHGSQHKLDFGRGMSEPSLAKFEDTYYLTMRNDKAAYVSTSDDGLHFSEAEKWRFDDGQELGSYNTQQHFLARPGGLYLAYTRRGADNDDVMRHRAPIFLAKIDPTTHRILRQTEQIVVPKEGSAAMGNFGVCNITPQESWIVVAKRTTTPGEKNVIVSRIRWE